MRTYLFYQTIMNLISYLKQPFPKVENKWKTILFISLFVPLFLFVFQPFGLSVFENQMRKYLFIGGYGLVSFVILIIDFIVIERLFQRFFDERHWCLYKEIIWLFCVVSTIGIGNMVYAVYMSGQDLEFTVVLNFQLVTFAVALFPITLFIISKQKYLLKKHSTSALEANATLPREALLQHETKCYSIYSYNQKVKEDFDMNDLYYIESKGNDIELHLYENDMLVLKTLRNTLKSTREQMANCHELEQCHRAYIVNLNNVKKVEGNSQGLLLKFANGDAEVPVSRTFVSKIKCRLADISSPEK